MIQYDIAWYSVISVMRLRLAEPLSCGVYAVCGCAACDKCAVCAVRCSVVSLVMKRGAVDKTLVQGRYASCVDCLGVWKAVRFLTNTIYVT